MSIKESALNVISTLAGGDYARMVTAAGESRRTTLENLASYIIEDYDGTSLAGSEQSIKEVLDTLNTDPTYVTPEMYGAKGDGVTDDTAAIQAAINSGSVVYFGKKTYLIASSVTIQNKENWVFNAENADITYTGTSYAFIFRHVVNAVIRFGTITAANGGCIEILGSTNSDFTQYLNISFIQFAASTNCIFADNTGNSWINEVRISQGRFFSGEYGVYIHHNSTNGITHWVFNEVGVEGVDCGFYFHTDAAAAAANKWISYCTFYDVRYVEAAIIFKNLGVAKNMLIVDAYGINSGNLNLTSDATEWTLLQSNGGAFVENGTLKKYGANHWIDISSAFTFDSNKVTAYSGFVAQYNPFTKQVMIGGNLTVDLASGYNDIVTISGYNAPYYCGLPFVIAGKYCGTHITGRNKIRVITTEAFSGNLLVGGSWVVQ